MKKLLSICLFIFSFQNLFSQVTNQEKMPVFEACKTVSDENQKMCFENQVYDFFYKNFILPEVVKNDNYQGTINVLFEVDTAGTFKKIYIASKYDELIKETERVFLLFPKITPGTYNGKPTYVKYGMNISVPLVNPLDYQNDKIKEEQGKARAKETAAHAIAESAEFDNVEKEYQKFDNPQFSSQLNIPFSHSYYAQFDANVNQVGTNSHTASKPLTYSDVANYYNFNEANAKLQLNKTGWWGRKLFNENLVAIQGKDYWFTMNPILDLRLGKTSPDVGKFTYNNTRAIQIQGGLGKQINFTTSIYESQGFFAGYYNRLSSSLKPSGGNPAIIPGIGIAKEFKGNQFDFPSADANITFTPGKLMNFQLGYSRNFIGDGYRSIFEGDGASPYPYFKINTTFWKIKYTNTYMWLKDVRPEATAEKTYATKYMANHYLSWNASKRLNIGFFESVIWTNTNNRGFDVNFVNPIIFYRSVEFSSSSKSGNAALGLTAKYKWSDSINFYSQFFIDEFAVGDMFGGEKSWRNKIGYQLGAKYYNAFGVPNLCLQGEYNMVRPYVYSHSEVITNYGHNNQSMGHNWGSNFNELVAIARYNKGRLFADAKVNFGVRGFDFDTATDAKNYGSNIYKDYDEDRVAEKGVAVGNGNKTNIFIADMNVGYLVNPNANLKLFANFMYRSLSPKVDTATVFKENTTWFSVGLRSDVFNWYFDY